MKWLFAKFLNAVLTHHKAWDELPLFPTAKAWDDAEVEFDSDLHYLRDLQRAILDELVTVRNPERAQRAHTALLNLQLMWADLYELEDEAGLAA